MNTARPRIPSPFDTAGIFGPGERPGLPGPGKERAAGRRSGGREEPPQPSRLRLQRRSRGRRARAHARTLARAATDGGRGAGASTSAAGAHGRAAAPGGACRGRGPAEARGRRPAPRRVLPARPPRGKPHRQPRLRPPSHRPPRPVLGPPAVDLPRGTRPHPELWGQLPITRPSRAGPSLYKGETALKRQRPPTP